MKMSRRKSVRPDQESVWDYPRPPRVEVCHKQILVIAGGASIAETGHSFRVLETSHPPVYYIPRSAVRIDLICESEHASFCEWKGYARYYSLQLPSGVIENAAWSYPNPTERFQSITGCLAFYPSKMDQCFVDGELVSAQPGDFYGGWITNDIVGPFKGGPSTLGW